MVSKNLKTNSDIRWIYQWLWLGGRKLGASGICLLLGAIVAAIDPLLLRRLIDVAIPSKNVLATGVVIVEIALCYLFRTFLYGAASTFGLEGVKASADQFRFDLLNHVDRLSADFHESLPLGEKLSRLDFDINEVANVAPDSVNLISRATLNFAINLTMMAHLSLPLTLATIPLLFVFFALQRLFRPLLGKCAEESRGQIGKTTEALTEHLNGVPQLQLLNAESLSATATRSVWIELFRRQIRQRRMEVLFSLASTLGLLLGLLLILYWGSVKVVSGQMSVGTLVALYAFTSRIFDPIATAMDLYARLQRVRSSIRRLRALFDTPLPTSHGEEVLTRSNNGINIRVDGVYSARGGHMALRHISWSAEGVSSVAIVGTSGAGKSTMSKLLARVIDPDAGEIFLDELPIRRVSLSSLRDSVCLVPQHPFLFSRSVRENLFLANRQATDEEMWGVLEVCQLTEVVSRLSLGLDSEIGANGARLSGGERQRLAIARALLRKPSLLILDEATSALDAITEQVVLASVRRYLPASALHVITHRLSSITWVDKVLFLDGGILIAQGTHPEVVASCPKYRLLFDAQMEQRLHGSTMLAEHQNAPSRTSQSLPTGNDIALR